VVAKRLATAPRAADLATWLFAAAAVGNLFVGRVPFAVGIAFAMGAWACVRRSPVAAAVLSLASVWASPVAGVYVCAGALAALVTGDRRTAIALGVPSLAGGVAMAAAFPEGGTDRFVATAFWPMLILSLCAFALLDPRHRTMRWAAIFYLALLVAAGAVRSMARVPDWHDALSLWESAARAIPDSRARQPAIPAAPSIARTRTGWLMIPPEARLRQPTGGIIDGLCAKGDGKREINHQR